MKKKSPGNEATQSPKIAHIGVYTLHDIVSDQSERCLSIKEKQSMKRILMCLSLYKN